MHAKAIRAMAIAGLACVLFVVLPAGGQPTRDRVLGDITIVEDPGCAVIRVGFNFPIRYLRHFPYETGDELRIRIAPIAISSEDVDALFKREAVEPPRNDYAGLVEVVFEGDIETGPYLTLLFAYRVNFEVKQGSDFRSLAIAVQGPEPSESCTPGR